MAGHEPAAAQLASLRSANIAEQCGTTCAGPSWIHAAQQMACWEGTSKLNHQLIAPPLVQGLAGSMPHSRWPAVKEQAS
jgi:hypothetical protein